MSSKPSPLSCFVYVTLPGQTEPVTAARFELSTSRQGEPLGRLVYGKSYLARPDAVPLEPLELPLLEQTLETTQLRGVFGALRDASPDFWGRRVIERHAGKPMLTELDSLLLSPGDRAGAERDCEAISGAFCYPGFERRAPTFRAVAGRGR